VATRPRPAAAAQAVNAEAVLRAHAATERFQALGRMPKTSMNRTEAAYAELLDERKHARQIIEWRFHPMNVRLAPNTFYEVDWLVFAADLGLEIHETKGGFTTVHGQLKIKLCAAVLPFIRMFKVTRLAKKLGGGWHSQEYFA
jgi:hypothetical protein